ncbi:FadR/GntR family transcriptional regulator [Chitinasiproducens palmae]|uniref:Transcriptional regulator, GntR family n=1 Tax=Chitinasiproducens palmae TaxID=1770053 RepID=A0A1H2PTF9_9BURK|nr:FCD domain-containing protein [Chitinasiproducens palmae]SDV50394.1 transcriptional regulator, GntR family [Chitinasiproducens palmae]
MERATSRRVERLVDFFETRLRDGSWQAGGRIPSERQLAASLDVARSTVREALRQLCGRGLLVKRAGSGVFVSDRLHAGTRSPWSELNGESETFSDDLLEFRVAIECAAARAAAVRAEPHDLDALEAVVARMSEPDLSAQARAALDAAFHEALAVASHNAMFVRWQGTTRLLLGSHLVRNGAQLRAVDTSAWCAQHRAIAEAIAARTPERAEQAMRAHLEFVRDALDRV